MKFEEGFHYKHRKYGGIAVYVVRVLSSSPSGTFMQVEWMDTESLDYVERDTLNIPAEKARDWVIFSEELV